MQGLECAEVKARVASLAQHHRDKKIIIGIDWLDYIKGIPQKLNALELFFDRHAEWIGKLVLIQVAIPNREDVKEYRELARSLHQQVDRVNGKYGENDSESNGNCVRCHLC